MKTLQIEGSYEGYVSVFSVLDKGLVSELLKIDDASERMEAAELGSDLIVFSNGINVDTTVLTITLDDEILYMGDVQSLPNMCEIVERDNFPKFESYLDQPNGNELRLFFREWHEDGAFVMEIEVQDEFNLADLVVHAVNLEAGGALNWGLYDQTNFQIEEAIEGFVINGELHEVAGDGESDNWEQKFLKISKEGKVSPDFELS